MTSKSTDIKKQKEGKIGQRYLERAYQKWSCSLYIEYLGLPHQVSNDFRCQGGRRGINVGWEDVGDCLHRQRGQISLWADERGVNDKLDLDGSRKAAGLSEFGRATYVDNGGVMGAL